MIDKLDKLKDYKYYFLYTLKILFPLHIKRGTPKSMLDKLTGEIYDRKVELKFEYKWLYKRWISQTKNKDW